MFLWRYDYLKLIIIYVNWYDLFSHQDKFIELIISVIWLRWCLNHLVVRNPVSLLLQILIWSMFCWSRRAIHRGNESKQARFKPSWFFLQMQAVITQPSASSARKHSAHAATWESISNAYIQTRQAAKNSIASTVLDRIYGSTSYKNTSGCAIMENRHLLPRYNANYVICSSPPSQCLLVMFNLFTRQQRHRVFHFDHVLYIQGYVIASWLLHP